MKSIKNFLLSAWKGQARLVFIWWGGFVFINVFPILSAISIPALPSFIQRISALLMLLFVIVGAVFWLISSWRCAYNARWRGWGYISRFMTIFILFSHVIFALGSVWQGRG
jgi:hypothetical protein